MEKKCLVQGVLVKEGRRFQPAVDGLRLIQ